MIAVYIIGAILFTSAVVGALAMIRCARRWDGRGTWLTQGQRRGMHGPHG